MITEPSDKIRFDDKHNLIVREKDLHIIVHGGFVAGKSSFIQTIADYSPSIELSLPFATVSRTDPEDETLSNPLFEALQDLKIRLFSGYGRIDIDEETALYFHEPTQNRRYTYLADLWKTRNLLGTIILVDSTFPETFREARSIIETFRAFNPMPFVVAANKQNLPNALPPEVVRERLSLSNDITVLPCNSQDKAWFSRLS